MIVNAEIDEAVHLLSTVLRPENPAQLVKEFPLVYGENSRGGIYYEKRDNQVVSGAAYLPIEVKTFPETTLKIGGIGSVTTHPDYRGQGLASKVLAECEKHLRKAGCPLAILWAPQPDLYLKNGYTSVGTEVDFLIPHIEEIVGRPSFGAVLPFAAEKDLDDCWHLYQARKLGVQRSRSDFAKLLNVPEMEILVCRHLAKTKAYAIVGKGKDFIHTVHEWCGEVTGLLAILRERFYKKQLEYIPIIASPLDVELIATMRAMQVEAIYGALGMMKIIDVEQFVQVVQPVLQELFQINLKYTDQGFVLHKANKSVVMDSSAFLRLMFGCKGICGDAYRVANELAIPDFKSQVPLQLFLWGLDSV